MTSHSLTTIYLVRHGETEWNRAGKMQGHHDSPLTGNGRHQAQLLGKGLRGKNIEMIYSSDLGRAVHTAEILNEALSLPIHYDQRLRERNLGIMQGLTSAEFQEKHPEAWRQFATGDPDYCIPQGESARQRYARSVECIEELATRHRGQTILVVAHGGILNGLFRWVLEIPIGASRHFSLLNGSINRISLQGNNRHLDCWGDTCHLAGLQTLDDN